jgi:thiol-disulfide isomerase/thioredoxin
MSSNIYQIINEDDLAHVLNNSLNRLVVINFSAKWCGPCQTMKPYFMDFAQKYPQAIFLTINVPDGESEGYRDVKYRFLQTVKSLPTYMAYFNSKRINGFTLEVADPKKLDMNIKVALKDIVSKNIIPTFDSSKQTVEEQKINHEYVPYESSGFAPLDIHQPPIVPRSQPYSKQ